MQTGYGLNLEQAQKLIITPELRQAITVLQLPTTELAAYVEEQLQENPLLEVREDGDGQAAEDQDGPDYDWVEYFQDSSDLGLPARSEERETRRDQFWSTPPSLAEHLFFQLALHPCSGRIREIAEYLTGNIDENGYLQVGVEEVALQLGVAVAEVEAALRVVQSLDPPGVGARDLRECLLLQVEHLGIEDGTLVRLIRDHLHDVGLGRLNRVAQLMNLPVQEVQRAADRLRTLDPKPGRNFAGAQQVRYIVPDVVVEKVAGEYVVLVNDVMVPRLTINNTYRAVLLQGKAGDYEARRFVEELLPIAGDPARQRWFDAWEAYNEPVPADGAAMRRLADFEAERTRLLAGAGIRSVIGNFGTGHPPLEMWGDFLPAVQAVQEHNGFLGLHEYSAPTMQFNVEGDEGWLTLRYRKVYRQILAPQGLVVPLLITECGIDGMVANRPGPPGKGWRDFVAYWAEIGMGEDGPGNYIEQLAWYDAELQRDEYVKGAAIFAAAASPGWETYEILGEPAPILRQYLSVHPMR